MELAEFLENLPKLAFVPLGNSIYLVNSKELYNPDSKTTINVSTVDELLDIRIDGARVRDIIEDPAYSMLVEIDGGRGSSSTSEKTFAFGHAGGNGNEDNGKKRFPAEFNDGDKLQSEEKALAKFRDKHANSDHEYAIAVDADGFVHQYIEGARTSVAISGRNGQLIIHNHPSGGAFSDKDLLSVSQNPGERGIIASGSNGDYIFTKGKNFQSEAFAKAVKNAQMKGTSYDDAVDKWLTKNQSKFGYKYEFRKA